MLHALQIPLGALEQRGQLPGVADVAVALELHADLDGAVAPDVAADAPVQLVLERPAVERLDVRLVRLRERGCCRRAGGRRRGSGAAQDGGRKHGRPSKSGEAW